MPLRIFTERASRISLFTIKITALKNILAGQYEVVLLCHYPFLKQLPTEVLNDLPLPRYNNEIIRLNIKIPYHNYFKCTKFHRELALVCL